MKGSSAEMYLLDTLYYLYKKEKRETLLNGSKEIAAEIGKPACLIAMDMIICSLKYGAMFTEYRDLDFAHRNVKNRETYITTFFNFKLYDKYNDKEYRNEFHDKINFLKKFDSLIKRDWIDINNCTDKEMERFLHMHDRCILKSSYGDSGKEVELYNISPQIDVATFRKYMNVHKYNLVEECLTNHENLAIFNESSLNTIRIVTIRNGNNVEFLFAGLRVGAAGAVLDNISQGGAVARIDLDSGKINSEFFGKKSSNYKSIGSRKSPLGKKIPFWKEVRQLAANAAQVIPEVRIVAWDICVTKTGPEIIEGNESFGSVIMQVFNKSNDVGLKPRLKEILEKNNAK